MTGRRIVVGDIHGCYDELMELLEKIGIGDDDHVISVGDLITKGPKSKEVLELFMTDARFSTVIGNHDLALRRIFLGDRFVGGRCVDRFAQCLGGIGGDLQASRQDHAVLYRHVGALSEDRHNRMKGVAE